MWIVFRLPVVLGIGEAVAAAGDRAAGAQGLMSTRLSRCLVVNWLSANVVVVRVASATGSPTSSDPDSESELVVFRELPDELVRTPRATVALRPRVTLDVSAPDVVSVSARWSNRDRRGSSRGSWSSWSWSRWCSFHPSPGSRKRPSSSTTIHKAAGHLAIGPERLGCGVADRCISPPDSPKTRYVVENDELVPTGPESMVFGPIVVAW